MPFFATISVDVHMKEVHDLDNKELSIFKTAIINEIEGEKFYREASQRTKDSDTANSFLHLADEEKHHQDMLRDMLGQIAKDQHVVLDGIIQGSPSPQIFAAFKSGDLEDALEISVFHIGILIEKASLDYYRQAAQSTTIESARSLYEYLADWEMHHLDEMEKIYDFITETWWDKQSYSPS
jgi:rubrerythrin